MSVFRQLHQLKLHVELAESIHFHDTENDSLYKYTLEHAVYHYSVLKRGEDLWELMNNDDFLQAQYVQTQGFEWNYNAFRYAIAHYVEQQGQNPQDDGRLCQLILRAGEVARKDVKSIEVTFSMFKRDASFLDKALERIEVLDEKNYFKACLRLMMIESWRQERWEKSQRDISIPQMILNKIDEHILDGTGSINWSDFILGEFMIFWVHLMLQTWDEIDLGSIYRRANSYTIDSVLESTAEIFIKNQQFDKATKIVQSLTKNERSILWGKITRSLALNGEIDKAIKMAGKIFDNNSSSRMASYSSLVDIAKILIQRGEVERAMTLANDIRKQNTFVLDEIAKSFAEHGFFEKSLYIASSIEGWNKTSTLIEIAKIHVQNGLIDKAIDIGYSIPDVDRSSALAGIATTLAQSTHQEKASALFEEAIIIAKQYKYDEHKTSALELALYDYHGVMEKIVIGLIECGMISKAIETIDEIKNEEKQSSLQIKIVTSLCTREDYDKAIEIVKSMIIPSDRSSGWALIVEYLTQKGWINKAIVLADQIENEEKQSSQLSEIAKYLAKNGSVDRSLTLEKSLKSSDHSDSVFVELAIYLAEKEDFDRAITISKNIKRNRSRFSALTEVAKVILKKRKPDVVIEMARKIDHQVISTAILSEVAKYLAKNEQIKSSLKVVEGFHHEGWIYKTQFDIANILIEKGETDKAKLLLERVIKTEEELSSGAYFSVGLFEIAIVLIQQGLREEGESVLDSIILNAINIRDDEKKYSVLVRIAQSLALYEYKEKAEEIFKKSIQIAMQIPRNSHRFMAVADISESIAQSGMMDYAIETAHTIRHEIFRTGALSNIANLFVQKGKEEDARDLYNTTIDMIKKLHHDYHMSSAFSIITKSLAQSGFIDEAIDMIENIKDVREKISALSQVAKSLAQNGRVEQSLLLIEQALQISQKISLEKYKDLALNEIVKSLAQSGMTEKALQTAQQIHDDRYRALALADIIQSLVILDERDKTIDLIEQVIHMVHVVHPVQCRFEVLSSIVKSLAQIGMTNKALELIKEIDHNDWTSSTLLDVYDVSSEHNSFFNVHFHILQSTYSRLFFEEFLPSYQRRLTKKNLFRYSFLYSSFSYRLAQESVYNFINLHLKLKQDAYVQSILKHCHQHLISTLTNPNVSNEAKV